MTFGPLKATSRLMWALVKMSLTPLIYVLNTLCSNEYHKVSQSDRCFNMQKPQPHYHDNPLCSLSLCLDFFICLLILRSPFTPAWQSLLQ